MYIKYCIFTKLKITETIKYKNKKIIILYSSRNFKNNNFFKKLNKKLLKENNKIVLSYDICDLLNKTRNTFLNTYIEEYKKQKDEFLKHINEVVVYILKLQNKRIEESNLYFLCKKYSVISSENIAKMSDNCKSINIVTSSLNSFKALEEMLDENGIPVTISNSKRKGVSKANIIINFDFNQEELSEFYIKRNAIILNLSKFNIFKLVGFEGVIINNVKLIQKDRKLQNFMDRRFGEIYNNDYDIIELIGNNGNISIQELTFFKGLNA